MKAGKKNITSQMMGKFIKEELSKGYIQNSIP
jgi:hypothetical protein